MTDGEATGTIENADLMPAALLARFGRATAEQVVTPIEERMAAPRRRGFRVRFAGREFQPGSERDFALGFLSSFAQPRGAGAPGAAPMGGAAMGGAAPMAMGTHAAGLPGAGMPGMSGAMGMGGRTGAMGTAGQHSPMGGAAGPVGYGPADGVHGGGLFGSMAPGGNLFSNSEFELNRESRGGILSVWSSSSRSYFSGMEDALSLDGDVRTTMLGADYARGPLTVGLSVGRTLGLGGYSGPERRADEHDDDRVLPVGGLPGQRPGLGVGGDRLRHRRLEPDAGRRLGARDGRVDGDVGGGDAGRAGRLAGHRRVRAGVQGRRVVGRRGQRPARRPDRAAQRVRGGSDAGAHGAGGLAGFTLVGGRLSLTPSVEVGLRRDGGDAETGAGMDVGGGLAFTDAVTGLSLDVRVRTLVVHQAEGFSERGMSLSFGWDPTPSSPLGLTAKVAPSWGGSARGGAEALWGNQMAYGMGSHQMYGSGDRVDAEVGYGLPLGARFVGTPRVGLTTSRYGRDYRAGYGLGVLEQGKVNFELGVDAQRRESATAGGASNGLLGRATLGW